METENIIATLKQGVPVTHRLVREIIAKLERIPAMERTIKAMDHDFAQLSVAYSAEISRREVQFTREECGYVCDALDDHARLKEAVANYFDAIQIGTHEDLMSARKAVEGLL